MTRLTLKQSKDAFYTAYKQGLVPSVYYSPDVNNRPVLKPLNFSSSVEDLTVDFNLFKSMFNKDGTLNSHSCIAESYAISLALDKKYSQSLDLFTDITACMRNIETVVGTRNTLRPVINRLGLLGFEGIFQFAEACYETGDKIKSEKLYEFIADLRRIYDGGPRFQEVKRESLQMLVNVFDKKGYVHALNLANIKLV